MSSSQTKFTSEALTTLLALNIPEGPLEEGRDGLDNTNQSQKSDILAEIIKNMHPHPKLREPGINRGSLCISKSLQVIGHIVHDVVGEDQDELGEVGRVVTVDKNIIIDGLEDLHQDESLRE